MSLFLHMLPIGTQVCFRSLKLSCQRDGSTMKRLVRCEKHLYPSVRAAVLVLGGISLWLNNRYWSPPSCTDTTSLSLHQSGLWRTKKLSICGQLNWRWWYWKGKLRLSQNSLLSDFSEIFRRDRYYWCSKLTVSKPRAKKNLQARILSKKNKLVIIISYCRLQFFCPTRCAIIIKSFSCVNGKYGENFLQWIIKIWSCRLSEHYGSCRLTGWTSMRPRYQDAPHICGE